MGETRGRISLCTLCTRFVALDACHPEAPPEGSPNKRSGLVRVIPLPEGLSDISVGQGAQRRHPTIRVPQTIFCPKGFQKEKKLSKKSAGRVAEYENKSYLCIAIPKRKSDSRPEGAVVQPVRIHACHAWGRGFESRPHRRKQKTCNQTDCTFFLSGNYLPAPIFYLSLRTYQYDFFSCREIIRPNQSKRFCFSQKNKNL